MDIDSYLIERVRDQQKWHSKKSIEFKRKHYILRVLNITLASAITILTYFKINDVVIVASAVMTALLTYETFAKYKDLWIDYRMIAESLKEEEMFFLTNSGAYNFSEEPFKKFVERCENIMANGNSSWCETVKATHNQENE